MTLIYFWLSADGKETLKKIELIKYCTKVCTLVIVQSGKAEPHLQPTHALDQHCPEFTRLQDEDFLLLCSFQSTGMLYIHK